MGSDPWNGDMRRSQSMNGWSYVENNPINLVDPTGMIPTKFPEQCRKAQSYPAYGDCVRKEYGVTYYHGDYEDFVREHLNNVVPEPNIDGCYEGPVPYRVPSYLEGHSLSGAIVAVTSIIGRDLVYDFASMERNVFRDTNGFAYLLNPGSTGEAPAISTIGAGFSYATFLGTVKGLRNWRSLNSQYEGRSRFTTIGIANPPLPVPVGAATGT